MKFFKKVLFFIVTIVGIFSFSTNIFAEDHVIKIAFVGDTTLKNTVIQKIFHNDNLYNDGNNIWAVRTGQSGKLIYKFQNKSLNENQLDCTALSECNVVFMVTDFCQKKNNLNETITKKFCKIRAKSNGSKVILIGSNADLLSENDYKIILKKINNARILYDKENFDYMLTKSNESNEIFRNNFFKLTDQMINWNELSPITENDLNILYELDPFSKCISKFDDMIGIDNFKDQLKSIVARIAQDKRDADRGKSSKTKPSYHMILKGNPGTGKTTIARRMADVFHDAGIIPTNKFIQVERKDLVGKYIGHTEEKVKKILKDAEGGVIFIDEAYSLCGGGETDFGKHVIEGLLTAMTDDKCIIITAGYPDKMQGFLDSNPGLTSRFKYYIDIPDYSEQDLFVIFKNLVSTNGFAIQSAEEQRIQDLFVRYFQEQKTKLKENFGNARSVETFFESAKDKRAMRLSRCPGILEDFITIEDVMHVINNN